MTGIGDFINQIDFANAEVELTREEAICVDYVLTSPSWDADTLGRLDTDRMWAIRRQLGRVLIGHNEPLVLSEDDVRMLLLIVPGLFAVGTQEVGSSVRRKLFEKIVGPAPVPELERVAGEEG
jgi:hypothetical protein